LLPPKLKYDERLWEKIKDNISAGFKIGRLTINGRFDLGRHTEL
jgi:hypothetical protein